MKNFLVVVLFVLANGIATAQSGTAPGWWTIPGTDAEIKVGGYVKVDLIHDFNPIGSPDFFDISKIPTDSSEGQTTHLNAKETRLFVEVHTPSDIGEIRTFVEGDFYGSGGSFRLRHAFVEFGKKILVGQTWSNFMDENIIPPTLDFEKPAAYAFTRHPIIRYSPLHTESARFSIALEEPSASAVVPAAPGMYSSPLPDLTAQYRYTKKWGHVQLSGFAGYLQYDYTGDSTTNINLFGGNISGQFNILKKDKLIYQAVYGPGVSRYRGGVSAMPGDDGVPEALTDFGVTLGYQHFWNDTWSSLVIYNTGMVELPESAAGSSFESGQYLAANVVWHFIPKAFAGIEYLYGTRNDFDGASGNANRIQFSMQYTFN